MPNAHWRPHSSYISLSYTFRFHSFQGDLTTFGHVTPVSPFHVPLLLASDIYQEKMAVCSLASILCVDGSRVFHILVKLRRVTPNTHFRTVI